MCEPKCAICGWGADLVWRKTRKQWECRSAKACCDRYFAAARAAREASHV